MTWKGNNDVKVPEASLETLAKEKDKLKFRWQKISHFSYSWSPWIDIIGFLKKLLFTKVTFRKKDTFLLSVIVPDIVAV